MDYRQRISLDPLVRSGKPCIRVTRIAVADVLNYLGGGMTVAEIVEDFPDLTAEHVPACRSFAVDRERRLLVTPA